MAAETSLTIMNLQLLVRNLAVGIVAGRTRQSCRLLIAGAAMQLFHVADNRHLSAQRKPIISAKGGQGHARTIRIKLLAADKNLSGTLQVTLLADGFLQFPRKMARIHDRIVDPGSGHCPDCWVVPGDMN